MSTTTRKVSTVDYKAAEKAALDAGSAFKAWTKGEESVTVQCVEAVRLALRTGLIHTGEGNAPEGTYSRAAYARHFFDLTNGSLVTLWSTLAAALDKGVAVDSDLFRVLAFGPKVGRKGGMAEAIGKAKTAPQIAKAVKAAGFDPKTGEKAPGSARNVGGQGGTGAATDSLTACVEAVKAMRKHLPKVADEAEYLKVRKAMNDLFVSQDKGRKLGKYAVKATAPKATVAETGEALAS